MQAGIEESNKHVSKTVQIRLQTNNWCASAGITAFSEGERQAYKLGQHMFLNSCVTCVQRAAAQACSWGFGSGASGEVITGWRGTMHVQVSAVQMAADITG